MSRKFPQTAEIYITCSEKLGSKNLWLTPMMKKLFFQLDEQLANTSIFPGTYVWYWYRELHYYSKDIIVIRKMLNPDSMTEYVEFFNKELNGYIKEMFRTIEFYKMQAEVMLAVRNQPKDFIYTLAKVDFESYNGMIGWSSYKEATQFYKDIYRQAVMEAFNDTKLFFRVKGNVTTMKGVIEYVR